jgi:chemotaxis protein MotD
MREGAYTALPLPSAMHVVATATAGTCVSEGSSERRDDFVFPQVPTADAVITKGAPRDPRASSAGVSQGAPEKPDAFVLPKTPPADSATPKEAPRDLRAAVSGGGTAGQFVSVLSQETHIAPAVLSLPTQGVRDRAGRAIIADEGAAPGQATEQAGRAQPSARMGFLAAAKPLGPSPDQPPSIVKPPSEQGGSRNAEGELGSSASATDRTVAGMANEPPRAAGPAPLPAHQIAGQIVAAAHVIQREEAQATGALAATPLSPPVVKILRLELQPADLGTITIRLSLKEDGLDIRVEASRYDTACMLQRDQDSLAKLLTTAGYRIDGMAVVATPTDGAGVPDGRSQTFLHSSTPQHGGSSQPDPRSSGGRPNAEPDPRTSRGNQNDDHDKSRIARGAGGDLYV